MSPGSGVSTGSPAPDCSPVDKSRGDVMTKKEPPVLDPAKFDLDTWLAGAGSQSQTLYLYPTDDVFAARLTVLERQAEAAERTSPEQRGLDDPSPEQVGMLVDELRREREASAIPITIRALRDVELAQVGAAAAAAKVPKSDLDFWILAEAIEGDLWTPDRIRSLHVRDRAGEQLVKQMIAAFNEIMEGPSAPFSPAS